MKYSIIMPVFNSADTVLKSINSILAQTYDNYELIVVDDGSTDNTLNICKNIAKIDRRVKVFSQDNCGPGMARNKGIKKCSGDYIAFLDSDDYYEAQFLENINKLVRRKAYDLVFIDSVLERKDGTIYGYDRISKYKDTSKQLLLKLQSVGTIPWGPCSKVCKADLIKDVSFSNLNVGEEFIYSFDLLRLANSIVFIEKPLYHYVHNLSGQHTKGGMDPWRDVVGCFAEHIKKNKIEKQYGIAVNTLALKSVILSIYRISSNNSYIKARKMIKNTVSSYSEEYDIFNYDRNIIDSRVKLLCALIRIRFYLVLYFLSVIRKRINK